MDSPMEATAQASISTHSIASLPKGVLPAEKHLPNLEDLRSLVFDTIINRLQALSIPISNLNHETLDFALPTSLNDGWSTLLEQPILLSDNALRAIIELKDTTGDQTDCPKGHTLFYLRSFPMRVSHLRALLNLWKKQGKRHAEAAVWEQMIKDVTDDSTAVWIRYIGMTNTYSGSERHRADKKSRDSGMFSDFVNCCDAIDRSIYRSAKIFHFVRAHLRPTLSQSGTIIPVSQDDADLHERVLISLFGLHSLLNRHLGGWFAVYQPSIPDITTFKQLDTSVSTKLANKALHTYPSESLLSRVTDWMEDTLDFAAQHTEELELVNKHTIDSRHKQIWIDQALPTRFFEQTLIVIIGDDIPLHSLTDPCAFWKQKARSSHLLRDYISRLLAYEQGQTEWDSSQIEPLVDLGVLPFFDHRYWPNTTNLCEESISLTRSYFEATKPWLALALGGKSNKFVRANFVSTTERSMQNLLGELSNLTVQYHTDPGVITTIGGRSATASNPIDPEHAFIQIPSFHPGIEKYGARSTELRRVMDITLWKTLLAIDVAMDILYRAKHDASFSPSRLEGCRLIVADVERRWRAAGADIIFDKAKKALKSLMDNVGSRWSKDDSRAYVPSCNGVDVNMTLNGKITMYWKRSNGEEQKVVLNAGVNVAPNKGEVMQRKIFFTSKGIDLQDEEGKSMTHIQKHTKTPSTNPTIPGHVIRKKQELGEIGIDTLIELWEHETNLVFKDCFSSRFLNQPTIATFFKTSTASTAHTLSITSMPTASTAITSTPLSVTSTACPPAPKRLKSEHFSNELQ